jgi:hypothetical protein
LRLTDLTDETANISIDDVDEFAIWQDAYDAAVDRLRKRQHAEAEAEAEAARAGKGRGRRR